MNSHGDYQCRLATVEDITYLERLNDIWQIHNLSEAERAEGYLSAHYTVKDFEILVANQEVVLATLDDEIIGYYLLNNFCQTSKRQEGLDVIRQLKEIGLIEKQARVGVGAQVVVDRQHQGKGLSKKLLDFLCETVKLKYDWLYSSLSKYNPKGYSVHTKEGWKVLYEGELCFYVFLYLHE